MNVKSVMKKGISKELAEIAKGAKFLREWARHTVFHPDMSALPKSDYRTKLTFSRASFDRRLAHQQSILNKAEQDNQLLNKFFEDSGFPHLSKNNSLVRLWSHKLSRLRELANRKRRKPSFPFSKTSQTVKEVRPSENQME